MTFKNIIFLLITASISFSSLSEETSKNDISNERVYITQTEEYVEYKEDGAIVRIEGNMTSTSYKFGGIKAGDTNAIEKFKDVADLDDDGLVTSFMVFMVVESENVFTKILKGLMVILLIVGCIFFSVLMIFVVIIGSFLAIVMPSLPLFYILSLAFIISLFLDQMRMSKNNKNELKDDDGVSLKC